MTEQKMEELRERLHTAMIELGFEETVINGKINYLWKGKCVAVSYHQTYAAIEIAGNVSEAKRNLYEDLDIYEYSYMENIQKDMFDEMRQDIVQYVVERY